MSAGDCQKPVANHEFRVVVFGDARRGFPGAGVREEQTDGRPRSGIEDGPIDFGNDDFFFVAAIDAGECAMERAFGDAVELPLAVFGSTAAIDVEVLRKGAERVFRNFPEQGGKGVQIEIDAGRSRKADVRKALFRLERGG